MSLTTIGRNVVLAERPTGVTAVGSRTADEVRNDANDKLAEARKDLLSTLTPWIPGDFVVTYGVLLTAWTGMRGSFLWLLIVSALSAITFVVLGAFSQTGFAQPSDRSRKVVKRLVARTVAGFLVSVYASAAIPRSGWYDFNWFAKHEQSCVLTASVAVVAIVFVLKGLQKRNVLLPSE